MKVSKKSKREHEEEEDISESIDLVNLEEDKEISEAISRYIG